MPDFTDRRRPSDFGYYNFPARSSISAGDSCDIFEEANFHRLGLHLRGLSSLHSKYWSSSRLDLIELQNAHAPVRFSTLEDPPLCFGLM